jgi:hypothetical protein
MSLLTEAWILAARLRRKVGKPTQEQWEADRVAWIEQHAPGRSFADLGGMLFLAGGRAFAAEDAGATAVTLADAGEPFPQWFEERDRRASPMRFVQGDLHDPETIAAIGRHDVVWCTGVIYHSPDPMWLLNQLREITGEYLFLGSHTIAEVPGLPQACVFYPYLSDAERRPLKRAYYGGAPGAWGVGTPFVETPMLGHGNFWWGITPSALCAMLEAARFEVVAVPRTHQSPWYTDVVARPVDRDPLLPPLDYYRRRGEHIARGEEPPPLEGYWDWAREREPGPDR